MDDRTWCASILKGTAQFEAGDIYHAKQKRQQRKDHLLHPLDSLTAATHMSNVPRHILSSHELDSSVIVEFTTNELLSSSLSMGNQKEEERGRQQKRARKGGREQKKKRKREEEKKRRRGEDEEKKRRRDKQIEEE